MGTCNKLQFSFGRWGHDSWKIARPFWTSEQKWWALMLAVVVITLNLVVVYINVLFNSWNNDFYNSLQQLDKFAFYKLLIKFSYLAFFYITCRVLAYYFHQTLEIRWRRWLTGYYLDLWLQQHSYYKSRFNPGLADNPDQRISEDINQFISIALSLSLGLISNLVSLMTFVVILWHLSGPLSLMLFTHKITVSGYMVWTALIYAFLGTWVIFKIGRPLIALNFKQEQVEANFRFSLMRVREYAENIALYQGEKHERKHLGKKFNEVVDNFVAIIYRQMRLTIFNSGYSQIAIIFPILVAAPRFFAKQISLGALMQIANTFGQVQGALSYFIDSYGSLASWRAVMDRLLGFQQAITTAAALPGLAKQPSMTNMLCVRELTISLPGKPQPLVNGINFSLRAGDRLLITGRSGSGKTTLLRVLAGIWPFAHGQIEQQPHLTSLFVAQKPYLPLLSLRLAVCYPLSEQLPEDRFLTKVMAECDLAHLAPYLDQVADWDQMLSIGEQQRIAFARVLINAPDIVYLDEATSAVDEEMEAHLYQLITSRLTQSCIISVAHRSSVARWHSQQLNFNNYKSN